MRKLIAPLLFLLMLVCGPAFAQTVAQTTNSSVIIATEFVEIGRAHV